MRKVTIVVLAGFFPVLVNTSRGLQAADPVALDRMRVLNASWMETFLHVRLPYALPFIAITEKAFTRLVNEQYAVLQRSIAAHEHLEQIVLSERGLEAVVTALATLVGGAALVFDARGHLRTLEEIERDLIQLAIEIYAGHMSEVARRLGIGRSTLYRKLENLGLAERSHTERKEPAEAY